MKKLTLSLIIALAYIQLSTSQNVKFGKITSEQLSEKYYPKDSSANAAYLYKFRNTYISNGNLITEIHHIIKFYNNEEFDFATKKIKLYKTSGTSESVSGLKANTYNLIDGKIQIEKLEKSSIFKSEYHKRQDHFTFTMPNIKPGSIIEYKYKIYSPFLTSIDEYVFQHSIPVKKLYSKLYTPAFFKFNKKNKGYLNISPKHDQKRDARLGFEVNTTEYIMSDIPALKPEPFVNNIENYRSSVEYELVAVNYQSGIKSFSQTWKDVAESINKTDTFKNKLKKNSYYKEELNELLITAKSNKEKIQKVFSFVKSKIKWNEIDGIYTFNGMSKAFKTGSGNVGDINLILISMIRHAGLKANPVLLSTKDNGIPIFPTLDGLNYIVCGVELNNKIILLDATNKYSSEDILPLKTMNWYGKLIRPDNTLVNIPMTPEKPSTTTTNMSVKIMTDGLIEGIIRNKHSRHHSFQFREAYDLISKDDYLAAKESTNENIEISNHKVNNLENLEKPIVETFAFSKEDYLEKIDNKIYFSPLFFFAVKKNPFLSAERTFPIDYIFPWEKKHQINIKIPEGYSLESLPESIKIKLPDNYGEFAYIIKRSVNSIQLSCTTKINYSTIPVSSYPFLKQFYNQMIKKGAEKIILVKK